MLLPNDPALEAWFRKTGSLRRLCAVPKSSLPLITLRLLGNRLMPVASPLKLPGHPASMRQHALEMGRHEELGGSRKRTASAAEWPGLEEASGHPSAARANRCHGTLMTAGGRILSPRVAPRNPSGASGNPQIRDSFVAAPKSVSPVPCVTSNAGPNGAAQLYWR